jgi:outer membrane protein assembly factor BamD (BamD/ComL family)
MKKVILPLTTALLMALAACSGDQGKQQLETAQFEEKQNNREHAAKLYEEVIRKYPGSPNAKTAQERLDALKVSK